MLLNKQPVLLVIRRAVDTGPAHQPNYWGASSRLPTAGQGPRHFKCNRCSGSLRICLRLNWPEAVTWTPALSPKAMHVALQSGRGWTASARSFAWGIKPPCWPRRRQAAETACSPRSSPRACWGPWREVYLKWQRAHFFWILRSSQMLSCVMFFSHKSAWRIKNVYKQTSLTSQPLFLRLYNKIKSCLFPTPWSHEWV